MEQSRETSKIRYTRHRTKTNNEEWNSPEKLARLGTQDTGQRQTMKNGIVQINYQYKVHKTQDKDKQ